MKVKISRAEDDKYRVAAEKTITVTFNLKDQAKPDAPTVSENSAEWGYGITVTKVSGRMYEIENASDGEDYLLQSSDLIPCK